METQINVEQAIKDVKALTNELTGRKLAIGISRGINRTLMQGRTEARKAVKEEYNIPQNQLSGINYKASLPNTLTGHIYASTKPIAMDAFSPRFETLTKSIRNTKKGAQRIKERSRRNNNPGKGVTIEIHKGSLVTVPFAFMIPGGRPRVFARGNYSVGVSQFIRRNKREKKGGTDIHINPLMSVTIYQTVINPNALTKIKGKLITDFPKNLQHELKYLIQQLPKNSI
jgi:hypothetical protein